MRALEDVDLTLEAGEVHCLVGENGSGKSTLIKIISGVEPPEPGGRIVIDGVEHAHLTPVESTRLGIQVIYQDLSLFPNLTVAENIAVGQHLGRAAPGRLGPDARDGSRRDGADRRRARPGAPGRRPLDRRPTARRHLPRAWRRMRASSSWTSRPPRSPATRSRRSSSLVRELKRQRHLRRVRRHRLDEVLEVAERVTVLRDGRKVGTFRRAEMDDHRLAAADDRQGVSVTT